MSDNVYNLPIKDCEDCIHKSVCRFIIIYNEIKSNGYLPIDFDTISCLAYISEDLVDEVMDYTVEDDDEYEYEIEGSVMGSGSDPMFIVNQVLSDMYAKGGKASKAYMSKKTSLLFGDVKKLKTKYGELSVVISNKVPYGEVHIPDDREDCEDD